MGMISLLTDFGLQDNFVGVMKAVILKINPKAQIVDLCHEIKPQGILEAAFLLKGSFKYFPQGTVHLVVVDPGVGSERKKLLVKTKNYFFLAPNNGVLSLALKEEPPLDIISITNKKYFLKPVSDTFHGRDIFAPISAYVSRGEPIKRFGTQLKSIKTLEIPTVKIKDCTLLGEVIYIDRFGNLVSNIAKANFIDFIRDNRFKIWIKGKLIDSLSHSYSKGLPEQPIVLFDSFGYLEVAIKNGSAQDYLGVGRGAKIKVVCLRR